jgi:hypothetical protein
VAASCLRQTASAGPKRHGDRARPESYLTASGISPPLAVLCSRQLAAGISSDAEVVAASVIAAKFGEGARDSFAELRCHFVENVTLRQGAFWEQLTRLDVLNPPGEPWQRLRQAQHHGIVAHLDEALDRTWLENALADVNADNR